MTTEDHLKTEERHQDFTIQTDLIAKAVMLLGKVLVPLASAGLMMLVANHFQQKQMAQDMVRMTVEIKEMRKEASVMSHKIAIMWSGGNWETKYNTHQE